MKRVLFILSACIGVLQAYAVDFIGSPTDFTATPSGEVTGTTCGLTFKPGLQLKFSHSEGDKLYFEAKATSSSTLTLPGLNFYIKESTGVDLPTILCEEPALSSVWGSGATMSGEVTVNNFTSGTRYYVAQVNDNSGSSTERYYSNIVKVTATTPNVSMHSAITGIPSTLTVGQNVSFSAWVHNNNASEVKNIAFYLKDDNSDVWALGHTTTISANGDCQLQGNITVPNTTGSRTWKLYYWIEGTSGGSPVPSTSLYSNQIEVTVSQPSTKSSDCSLKSLTVSPGYMWPSFSGNVTNYSVSVAYSVSSINIAAAASHQGAKVTGDTGKQWLSTGENTFKIKVTAENGNNYKEYVITVTRAGASSNCNLKNLTVSQGVLSPSFHTYETYYTVSVAYSVASINIAAAAYDPNAKIAGCGSKALSVGPNIFVIRIMAENMDYYRDYTVKVIRASSPVFTENDITLDGALLYTNTLTASQKYTIAPQVCNETNYTWRGHFELRENGITIRTWSNVTVSPHKTYTLSPFDYIAGTSGTKSISLHFRTGGTVNYIPVGKKWYENPVWITISSVSPVSGYNFSFDGNNTVLTVGQSYTLAGYVKNTGSAYFSNYLVLRERNGNGAYQSNWVNIAPNATSQVWFTVKPSQISSGVQYYITSDNKQVVVSGSGLPVVDYVTNVGNIAVSAIPFKIYPNPADKILTVQIPNPDGAKAVITLTGLSGHTAYRAETYGATQQIDVQSLQRGIYIMQVSVGEETYTAKVIRQ
jgi:hypothetical protein